MPGVQKRLAFAPALDNRGGTVWFQMARDAS
jgi:hypothetical protein